MAMPLLASMLLMRRPTVAAARPDAPAQLGPVTLAVSAARAACDPSEDHLAERNLASLLRAELDALRVRVDRVTRILDGLEAAPLFTASELAAIGGRP